MSDTKGLTTKGSITTNVVQMQMESATTVDDSMFRYCSFSA